MTSRANTSLPLVGAGNTTIGNSTSGGGISPKRNHRPPAKKQMGSVFRYLTDVEGSALADIKQSTGSRAQSAPQDGNGAGGNGTSGGGGGLSPRRSPRANALGGGPGGGKHVEGKMRLLDDYFAHFPIDRPSSAAPLTVKGANEADSNLPLKGNRQAALDQEIRKYEQEAHTRKVGKEAATKTFNNLRKKQNFDSWLAVSERNNRKMRRENDALAKLAQIAQENCIDNDSKYEEVLGDLRNSVELAALIRRNDDPNLKLMDTQFKVIDRRIDDICDMAKEQVATEYSNLKVAFERQVEKQSDKLDAVKEEGKTTTEQWRQRNNEVQEGLLVVLNRLVEADEEKKVLQKDLQKLRVSYGAQDNDGPLLEKEFRKVTKKHQQLKERMQILEVQVSQRHAANFGSAAVEDDINATTRELIQTSGQVGATLMSRDEYQRNRGVNAGATNYSLSASGGGGGTNVSLSGPALSTSAQMLTEAERRQREYAQTLQNAEDLLETEAQNLRVVRQSHAAALRQRTELEVFLLQSILYHRQFKEHKIKEGALTRPHNAQSDLDNNTQSAELTFDAEDRKKVIERLLSQDRVINLLYGGGVSAEDGGNTSSSRRDDGGGLVEGAGNRSHLSSAAQRSVQAMTPMVAAQNLTFDQGEVSQLWEKWRRWTSNAQKSLDKQYASEEVKE